MANAFEIPSLADPGGGPRARIDALNARAWAEHYAHPQQALELAQEARDLSAAEGYTPGLAASLRTIGICRFKQTGTNASEHDLQTALDLFRTLGDRAGEGTMLRWLGHLHTRRGDFGGALRLMGDALLIEREIGDRAGEADTLLAIGNNHQQLGDFAEALRHSQAARRIKEELGDTLGVAACLNNLGNAHSMLGEYELALENYHRSLEIHRAAGAPQADSTLSNIGSTYRAMGRPHEALECFSRALAVFRECGDRHGEVCALANIGEMRHLLGQHEEALELLDTALAAARELGHRYEEAATLVYMGEALAARGDRALAVCHLQDAARTGGEIGARELVVQANRTLARIHEETGDVAEAFRCYKAYRELESEIFGQKADQKIRAVIVRAEVEAARREAELLRRENEELAALNQGLATAGREQTDLLVQVRGYAAELERQTREDALTGVYNRRYLDGALAAELERARSSGREVTVAMADVDCFKQVNDRFSHAVGDQVLRQVAALLREGVGPGHGVARYGGEEFVLVLAETPLEQAVGVCEALRMAVRGFGWESIHPGLRVTLSLGLASSRAAAGPEPLLAAADARLYEAKRAGRDRVCWGPPPVRAAGGARRRACS